MRACLKHLVGPASSGRPALWTSGQLLSLLFESLLCLSGWLQLVLYASTKASCHRDKVASQSCRISFVCDARSWAFMIVNVGLTHGPTWLRTVEAKSIFLPSAVRRFRGAPAWAVDRKFRTLVDQQAQIRDLTEEELERQISAFSTAGQTTGEVINTDEVFCAFCKK